MSKIVDEVVGANQKYAREFGAKGELALPPARRMAILTCMDSRYTAREGVLGVRLGDAHVIRNAGGRVTDDAIRSLVLSAHGPWAHAPVSSFITRTAEWRADSSGRRNTIFVG